MSASIISGARSLRRDELLRRARRAATGLAGLGVQPGQAVALLMRNELAFLEASVAVATAGGYTVPCNWHAKPEEIAFVLGDSGARVVVVHDDLAGLLKAADLDGVTVLHVATPPEVAAAYGIPAGGRDDWGELIEANVEWDQTPLPPCEAIFYTSGTTGRPKGVRFERPQPEQVEGMGKVRGRMFGFRPGMRAIVSGPMYHAAPSQFGNRSLPLADVLVLMPRFDAEELLALIERHRIDTLFIVPTMMIRLLALPAATRARYDLSSLRSVTHAAAPCAPQVKRAIIDWWGPIINEFYGATEVSGATYITSEEWLERPGSVGKAMPEATVKVFDDDGREVPRGEVGEVYMRLSCLPDFTYHGRSEARREVERDGLITVGDVGFVDEAGYLHLCDRKRDLVISGGVNVYPAEIEAVLLELEGVRDSAVFGIPDSEFGEALHAAIDAVGVNERDVRTHLRERLADFKVPRTIEFRDDLPRDDSGKILKRLLREPFWQAAGRSI